MTMSEALSVGIQTSVVGLSIVFAVLIILMLVLKLFEKIFYKAPKDNNINKEKIPSKETNIIETAVSCEQTDDEELIAVLTAAIAASLNTSTYNLKIKSYRRMGNGASEWNKAGVRETIENRF